MKISNIRDTLLRSERNLREYTAVWMEFWESIDNKGNTFFKMVGTHIADDEDCIIRICFEI